MNGKIENKLTELPETMLIQPRMWNNRIHLEREY